MNILNISSVGLIGAALSLLTLAGCGSASDGNGPTTTSLQSAAVQASMVGAWSTAPYGPYPLGPLTQESLPTPGAPEVAYFPNNQAINQSFRMIIHPTIGGEAVRIRLSNLMGDRPVRFENISIAKGNPLLPTIDEASKVAITAQGQAFGIAQPGEELITDTAAFNYSAGDDLAISFHVAGESGPMTWHAVSFAPQYVSSPDSGDVTSDANGISFNQVSVGWFFLSGLDVVNPQATGAIVAIGDSITDGAFQVLNQRWPDFLAQRLNASGQTIGILNQGINSNTVTEARDGYAGPPLINRFNRDVLERSRVDRVIILEGTNDLGAGVKADDIIAGLENVIAQAREGGLCVFVGTLLPRLDVAFGWFPDGPTVKEPERQKVNEWIRTTDLIDGVVDFDTVMGLPGNLGIPNAALYTPDLLHPNSVGFMMMADAIDLEALLEPCN